METVLTPTLIQQLAGEIIPILVASLLTVVTAVTGFASRSILQFIKSKTTVNQQNALLNLAKQAVLAAEQLGINNVIQDKKEWAFELVDELLKKQGINVTAAQINAAIEATVMEEFNKQETIVSGEDVEVVVPADAGAEGFDVDPADA